MAIPTYEDFMLPLLRRIADGQDHRTRDLIQELADSMSVPPPERQQLLPSGRSTILYSRIQWAKAHMKQAGLVEGPTRGVVRITEEGRCVLVANPPRIDSQFLRRYSSYVDFLGRSRAQGAVSEHSRDRNGLELSLAPPEELVETTIAAIQQSVADELLERIAELSSTFFERLVVKLLVGMGYGGSYAEAAKVVGQSGDEGIDGIIKEDRLGLDRIYVQAKRWQNVVRRPDVQAFAGSLEGVRARKGVFITTSHFTPDAHDYVEKIEKRIVLIDGQTLAALMIEHGVGVVPDRRYVIPKVDLDFFDDE